MQLTLTKNKLFTGVLLFGLTTILLVVFNIQLFYLRALTSFIFLTTIPGLLIMLMLKIRKIEFWEYLVYTIGLSIAFLMFAGLAINWILPWLHITDQPLSLMPLITSFDIILSIFGFIAFKRNKKISLKISLPKINRINKIFFALPIIFPILSILGATTLNNGGPNYLTMILLLGIATYVLLVVLSHNKLSRNIYPWSLLLISISLILMGSLRSWYISHTDAALEYALFKLVVSNGLWSFWKVQNSYNGMLSVTMLPSILFIFMKCNEFLILKLIFPLFFSLVSVVMFVFFNKLFNKEVSFFGTLFYVSQPAFTAWTLMTPRQEIALLFFGLIFLISFSEFLSHNAKKILFIIFGFSMVVSHYSASYIALVIFILILFSTFIYNKWENRKVKTVIPNPKNTTHFHLSGLMVLLLLLFECVWYFKITTTGIGLVNFTYKSLSNINKVLNQNVYSQGNSPLEYLDVLGLLKLASFNPTNSLNNYVHDMQGIGENKYVSQKISNEYPTFITDTSKLPWEENVSLYLLSERIMQILLLTGGLLILLGLYSYMFLTKPHEKRLIFTGLVFLISLVALIVLPFASINYTPDRTYQQVLAILSVFSVYGIFRLFKSHLRLAYFCFSLFILTYLILFTHVQYYFIGGREIQLRFANIGKDYDLNYVTANEISSADWLFMNKKADSTIDADIYANYKIYQSKYYDFTKLKIDVLPETINKEDYVFSSRTNTLQGVTFKYYEGGLLFYNFPLEFLNANKNLVYNNGGSEIFK